METIWDVVSARAADRPSDVAIRGDREYTYEELIGRAGILADHIARYERPGCFVVLDDLSPAGAATAMLAAAGVGCAVLPLTADCPPRQREYIFADARPALVIRERDANGNAACHLVAESANPELPARATCATGMGDVAYVLYTSGSTGRPKGVLVPHAALLDRLAGLARLPGFGPSDSILAMTAISFDISVAELLLPLAAGGSFVAAPRGTRTDPAIFDRAVAAFEPSVIQATPSFWRLALAWGWHGPTRARLWCGGEALTPSLADRLLPATEQLWNVYGPTEATIWATASRVQAADQISLGSPIPGTELFLDGEDGQEVTAPGEAGEIVLSGAGLAVGYLNQPGLTAGSFIVRRRGGHDQRCYRTGDLAARREDGSLRFIGRVDDQVKVRGHRMELGEFEAVAERHPAVREAAAVVRDSGQPDQTQVVMFVVTDGTASLRDIRKWLADWLPQDTRPQRIVICDELPRTTAGKVDRIALAARELQR